MVLGLADERVQDGTSTHSSSGIESAYLIDAYVLLDGTTIPTPSFLINGQVFHRYDILLWMGHFCTFFRRADLFRICTIRLVSYKKGSTKMVLPFLLLSCVIVGNCHANQGV